MSRGEEGDADKDGDDTIPELSGGCGYRPRCDIRAGVVESPREESIRNSPSGCGCRQAGCPREDRMLGS